MANCWTWAISRWAQNGYKGELRIMRSPRSHVLRACWAPEGDKGPLWHFEPLHPKKGLKAIWHAYLHEGQPKDMR
jgi:hypothetical protein